MNENQWPEPHRVRAHLWHQIYEKGANVCYYCMSLLEASMETAGAHVI